VQFSASWLRTPAPKRARPRPMGSGAGAGTRRCTCRYLASQSANPADRAKAAAAAGTEHTLFAARSTRDVVRLCKNWGSHPQPVRARARLKILCEPRCAALWVPAFYYKNVNPFNALEASKFQGMVVMPTVGFTAEMRARGRCPCHG